MGEAEDVYSPTHSGLRSNSLETEESAGSQGVVFDVSDILANYFSNKLKDETPGGEESPSYSETTVKSSRHDESTEKRKEHKKKHKQRRHRHRDPSEGTVPEDRDRRYRSERTTRSHRHRHKRKHRSHSGDRRRSDERSHEILRGRSKSPMKRRHRSRSRSSSQEKGYNKSELLEVARRNVKLMLVNGTLPQGFFIDHEKMGFLKEEVTDSIERYTEMCRKITEGNGDEPSSSEPNHPFVVKDRPIRMNIANSVSVPTKTSKEKILGAQFPVSSGCSHRQLEWKRVEPEPPKRKKKKSPTRTEESSQPIAIKDSEPITSEQPDPVLFPLGDSLTMAPPERREIRNALEEEIRSLSAAQLLEKVRDAAHRLQSNPFDVEAKLTQKYCDDVMREMNLVPPDTRVVTGYCEAGMRSLPANPVRPHAWAFKDQLRDTKAVNSGIGMILLQKMGWTPGTALGKDQEGLLEPLLPPIKFDRKGLSAQHEAPRRIPTTVTNSSNSTANRSAPETAALQKIIDGALGGKHPVTLLLEICATKKLKQPLFVDLPAMGEPHDRTFLCSVKFNEKVFIPKARSLTKKLAKAQAALVALADIGEYDVSKHEPGAQ